MIKRLATSPTINLARKESDPALMVDLESFFDFSFWMAEELQDLISTAELKELRVQPKFTTATDNFDAPYENWVEWE